MIIYLPFGRRQREGRTRKKKQEKSANTAVTVLQQAIAGPPKPGNQVGAGICRSQTQPNKQYGVPLTHGHSETQLLTHFSFYLLPAAIAAVMVLVRVLCRERSKESAHLRQRTTRTSAHFSGCRWRANQVLRTEGFSTAHLRRSMRNYSCQSFQCSSAEASVAQLACASDLAGE